LQVASGAAPAQPPRIHWRCRRFEDLGVYELQAIYQARQQVFAVEQQCVYLDADGFDACALHLCGWAVGSAVPLAYARVLPPGTKYAEASIGRVLTTSGGRGTGLGRTLMHHAVAASERAHRRHAIRISAQSRLARFYQGFGFVVVGAAYLEDGIPHIEMLRPPS
jgi:ElaA protein